MTLGFCQFVSAFITDIEINIDKLSPNVLACENEKTTAKKEIELKENIGEIFRFYLEAKE